MKPLSETYKELGVDFSYPIEIKDAKGKQTYHEDSDGFWWKREYDANGNQTYREDNTGYWSRYEYDANGRETYFENSTEYWAKYEYDANGRETYFENSSGCKRGDPKSAKSDTPRTDEQLQSDAAKYDGHSQDYVSLLNFARELERELNELKARHKTAILECTQYTPESWRDACEFVEPCAVWLDGPQMTQLMKDKEARDKSI